MSEYNGGGGGAGGVCFTMAERLERLILLVSECPVLYDLAYERYRDINKKAAAWRKVAEDAGMSGRLNVMPMSIVELVMSNECFINHLPLPVFL